MPNRSISFPDPLYRQLTDAEALTSARVCDLVRHGLEVERLAKLSLVDRQLAQVMVYRLLEQVAQAQSRTSPSPSPGTGA